MSDHTDYDRGDKGGTPLSEDTYLGLIYNLTGKTAPDLHLLDCGCGPGTYVHYLLEHGLGKATIVDKDDQILEHARKRLHVHEDKVNIKNVVLPVLPFPDATFDVAIFSNVLHILPERGSQIPKDYTPISNTLKEARRVLKPNGVIIINETTPTQAILHWAPTYPFFMTLFLPLLLSSKSLLKLVDDSGFKNGKRMILPDHVLDPKRVYIGDCEAYFQEKLPDYETMVSLVSCPEERKRLHSFANCLDELKDMVGTNTIYFAQKL